MATTSGALGLALSSWIGTAVAAPSPAPAPETPAQDGSTEGEPPADAADPTSAPEAAAEPEPEPACTPACPEGTVCHEGQCLASCEPACTAGLVCVSGECHASLAAGLEPAPAPAPAPASEPVELELAPMRDETEDAPPSDVARLSLVVTPGVAACLGQGCRRIQVGRAQGAFGVGGALDLRLAYRPTPHVSFELGGTTAIHGNDIDDDPLSMWMVTQVGARLHPTGDRWRAEPVIGMQIGYVRSLVRWTNAGSAADGLSLGVDVGVRVPLNDRLALGMTTAATLPHWTRVCDVDAGIRQCFGRSQLDRNDRNRYFWVTGLTLTARLR